MGGASWHDLTQTLYSLTSETRALVCLRLSSRRERGPEELRTRTTLQQHQLVLCSEKPRLTATYASVQRMSRDMDHNHSTENEKDHMKEMENSNEMENKNTKAQQPPNFPLGNYLCFGFLVNVN